MLFFALSSVFLPYAIVTPHKFALLFTMGSICVLLALAFYHGPFKYLSVLFSKEKWMFSLLYIVSVVCTLWASLVWKSYIFTFLALGC